jgi:hypothetical protein
MLNGDQQAATKFHDFQLIVRENVHLEKIYNADKTELLWKCLLTKILGFETE